MKHAKILALTLALLFSLSLLPSSAAAVQIDSPEDYAADILYQLGLFQGVGKNSDGSPNYDLLGTPTREVAITMLVRLLGKEAEVKKSTYTIPFTDVSSWAKPYVGYAYKNKLTLGTSKTTFGGSDAVTAAQYLTFVLRALGYSSDSDFSWSAPWDLSDALGMTYGEYDANSVNFSRGDVAIISAAALGAPMKNSENNLLMHLKDSGALAPNKLALMDLKVIACQKNTMNFAFFPIPGSPNTYSSFRLDKVTVNGLPCKIQQYTSGKEAKAALPSLAKSDPDIFNYCVLTYEEEKAKKAAEHFTDLGGGHVFPILIFTFDATGTLPDGTKVSETFSEAVYIDGYGETR